jgi:hypothetical protein
VIVSRRAIIEEERAVKKVETLTTIREGALLTGTVKNIIDYGVFVELIDTKTEGLIKTSTITGNWSVDMSNHCIKENNTGEIITITSGGVYFTKVSGECLRRYVSFGCFISVSLLKNNDMVAILYINRVVLFQLRYTSVMSQFVRSNLLNFDMSNEICCFLEPYSKKEGHDIITEQNEKKRKRT